MMETFHKYVKIKQLGSEENQNIFLDPDDEIVIQEKVDGANFRFMIHKGRLIFGSRTQQLTSDEGEDVNVQKGFKRAVDYVRKGVEDSNLKIEEYEHFIFYTECMVPHSIHYDWERTPAVLGYDIFNLETERFINYEQAKILYEHLGIPFVPIIRVCKAREIKGITDDDVPKSQFYEGPAEGIVMKNYHAQLFAKYVTDKFKEVNKATFGGSKKWARDDEEKIVMMYCTNARIDKTVFKLADEGHPISMELMRFLPKAVTTDIFEENWQEILLASYKIDTKKIRRLISHRCLAVLKQVIALNAINKKEELSDGSKI